MSHNSVSYIEDYKVNDTVFVDVTLLQAKTDSAWTILQTDFDIPILLEEYQHLINNYNSIDSWLVPKDNYKSPMDTIVYRNDAIVISRRKQIVSVFHLREETPIDDIFEHKLNEL